MTPAVAEAVQAFLDSKGYQSTDEPSLESPAAGNPISHGQLIEISRHLKSLGPRNTKDGKVLPITLDELLRGCAIYTEPKPEKKAKVSILRALRTLI
jgi:TMEM199 family protein